MTIENQSVGSKSKILIVDDTLDTVELLKKRFRADGFATVEAYDGEEGLRRVSETKPDLIVLDIMMPKIDGLEVCTRLKSDATTRHIPILMLTAKSEVPDKVRGLDTGADGYITKPFDYKEVSAMVRSLLSKKDATSKLAEKEKFFALDHMVDEVSHEVRNPLVAIGGVARRLQKDLPAGSQARKYADIILKNVETLEKMVEQLIDLKSATIAYPEATHINPMLRDVLAGFADMLSHHRITVIMELQANLPPLQADRQNLARAFANIVENCIEAMDGSKRELTVGTGVQDNFLEIRISDTGKGIPKEKIKNICDPFFTTKTSGPGLGLTFALKTIQNHKGLISVHSEEGVGTTFIIRLPFAPLTTACNG